MRKLRTSNEGTVLFDFDDHGTISDRQGEAVDVVQDLKGAFGRDVRNSHPSEDTA